MEKCTSLLRMVYVELLQFCHIFMMGLVVAASGKMWSALLVSSYQYILNLEISHLPLDLTRISLFIGVVELLDSLHYCQAVKVPKRPREVYWLFGKSCDFSFYQMFTKERIFGICHGISGNSFALICASRCGSNINYNKQAFRFALFSCSPNCKDADKLI